MKRAILFLLIALMLVGCVSGHSKESTENKIIQVATYNLSTTSYDNISNMSVFVDNVGYYHAYIGGREQVFEVATYDNAQVKSGIIESEKECIKVDKKTKKIIDTSKQKVIEYIKASNVLRDKDELIAYIKELKIVFCAFEDSYKNFIYAVYDHNEDMVFMNANMKGRICERIIIHELIHALSQKTNGGFANLKYPFGIFNETLTDIIALNIEPEYINQMEGMYLDYFEFVYEYLACVGICGIEAYYYGYDTVYEKIPETEMLLFVKGLESINESYEANELVYAFLAKWSRNILLPNV